MDSLSQKLKQHEIWVASNPHIPLPGYMLVENLLSANEHYVISDDIADIYLQRMQFHFLNEGHVRLLVAEALERAARGNYARAGRQAVFDGEDLRGQDFSHFNLTDAIFRNGTNISGVSFVGSTLISTTFEDIEAVGTNFSRSYGGNLYIDQHQSRHYSPIGGKIVMSMAEACIHHENGQTKSPHNIWLRGLHTGLFQTPSLGKENSLGYEGAVFKNVNAKGAKFNSASWPTALIQKTNLDGSILPHILSGSVIINSELNNISGNNTYINSAIIQSSRLNGKMHASIWNDTRINGNSVLKGLDIGPDQNGNSSQLVETHMDNADVTDMNFCSAQIYGATFLHLKGLPTTQFKNATIGMRTQIDLQSALGMDLRESNVSDEAIFLDEQCNVHNTGGYVQGLRWVKQENGRAIRGVNYKDKTVSYRPHLGHKLLNLGV